MDCINVESFDVSGLSKWLAEKNVKQSIIEQFKSNGIDGKKMASMSSDELQELGIPYETIASVLNSKELTSQKAKTHILMPMKPESEGDIDDVFVKYDCEKLRDSTLETALNRIGITQKDSIYKLAEETAKLIKGGDPNCKLSTEDIMAILAYTYDYGKESMEKNLYSNVNKRLREGIAGSPYNIDLFILYFLKAIRRLERYSMGETQKLYRGIPKSSSYFIFKENSILVWNGFTSTTSDRNMVTKFLGWDSGRRYLIEIVGNPIAYSISDYSFVIEEKGKNNLIISILFYLFIYRSSY